MQRLTLYTQGEARLAAVVAYVRNDILGLTPSSVPAVASSLADTPSAKTSVVILPSLPDTPMVSELTPADTQSGVSVAQSFADTHLSAIASEATPSLANTPSSVVSEVTPTVADTQMSVSKVTLADTSTTLASSTTHNPRDHHHSSSLSSWSSGGGSWDRLRGALTSVERNVLGEAAARLLSTLASFPGGRTYLAK